MENKSLKRVHPPAFKARVAIEAIKGEKTLAELTSIYGIHHSMIIEWKQAATIYPRDELTVDGVVISVIRTYHKELLKILINS